jgi:hypothetical protein
MNKRVVVVVLLLVLGSVVVAETVETHIAGTIELAEGAVDAPAVSLAFDDAVMVTLIGTPRFFIGVEFELNAPAAWLAAGGGLAIAFYNKVNSITTGNYSVELLETAALETQIQTVYQVPFTRDGPLHNTPYVTVLGKAAPQADFPLMFRLLPLSREVSDAVRAMRFQLSVRPITSDNGAVKVTINTPPDVDNKPYTVFIDDKIIEQPAEEHILPSGEHHLMLIASDYRNESRRFILERGKTLDITITLQDLTPLVLFETPANAIIIIDETRFTPSTTPKPLAPGPHTIKIQVSDYTIIKTLYARKGKTYRVSFIVNLDIVEED